MESLFVFRDGSTKMMHAPNPEWGAQPIVERGADIDDKSFATRTRVFNPVPYYTGEKTVYVYVEEGTPEDIIKSRVPAALATIS